MYFGEDASIFELTIRTKSQFGLTTYKAITRNKIRGIKL